jgi:hypothetical protein
MNGLLSNDIIHGNCLITSGQFPNNHIQRVVEGYDRRLSKGVFGNERIFR